MGRGLESNFFHLASPYALAFVETNFSLKRMRRIVLELIFISYKCELIAIYFTVIDISINIWRVSKSGLIFCFLLIPETQCLNAFIQILLNSDLKASMRVENLTQYNYPTAPDKKVQMKLSYRYLPSKHLLFWSKFVWR